MITISTLIFLAARQSGLLLPDAAGPDQMFTSPDQLFVSEVRKCIITWFSLADTKQFQSHFTFEHLLTGFEQNINNELVGSWY